MDLGTGGIEGARAIHDEMRAGALFRIRHLPREQRVEPLRRHAGPLQHARALHLGRRRDDHHRIDAFLAAGLEQQRNVEHDGARAFRVSAREEPLRHRAHQRMHDRFEPLDRVRIADELFGELSAVDPAVGRHAGKRRLDRPDRLALIEPVHHRVGIVHRHAGLAKEVRGGRLAHADRAGEAEDEHFMCRSSRECPLPGSRAVRPSPSA